MWDGRDTDRGAVFPNPGNIFAARRLLKSSADRLQQNALVVPQRSVSELQGGYQGTVVGPDNKVRHQTVTVGYRVGRMGDPYGYNLVKK